MLDSLHLRNLSHGMSNPHLNTKQRGQQRHLNIIGDIVAAEGPAFWNHTPSGRIISNTLRSIDTLTP
jgi:hypothetical protein